MTPERRKREFLAVSDRLTPWQQWQLGLCGLWLILKLAARQPSRDNLSLLAGALLALAEDAWPYLWRGAVLLAFCVVAGATLARLAH